MRVGALCAGYGGLELGLQLAGIDTDLVWVSETDKHASAVLDARFGVPNLGDLTEIVDPPQVDAITAGFPCQPVSQGGKRAGIYDSRWLIRDVVSVAREAGAQWIFMENVRGLLSANNGEAFGQVLDALAEGGFDAEWACIRADQSVGACHRRDRWFCVAYTSGERHGGQQDGGVVGCVDGGAEGEASQRQRARQVPVDRGAASVADAAGVGSQELRPERGLEEAGGEARRLSGFGAYEPAVRRWEQRLGRVAPPPTDEKGVSTWFVEWMMGLPSGWVCDMGLSRTQELKMLGNGVVPQQAAAAYGWLMQQVLAAIKAGTYLR